MSDLVYMEMAHTLAKLSKCVRLQVGCLLVKDGRAVHRGKWYAIWLYQLQ